MKAKAAAKAEAEADQAVAEFVEWLVDSAPPTELPMVLTWLDAIGLKNTREMARAIRRKKKRKQEHDDA
jgi:hypothetical protein